MFVKNTAFILGAGASWHYNYPTGEDIVKRIIDKTKTVIGCFENDKNSKTIERSDIPNYFIDKYPDTKNFYNRILFDLNNFLERLLRVDPPVIDYFLAWNEDLHDIGKLMIAWVILDRESEYARYKNINRNHVHNFNEAPYEDRVIKNPNNFKDNWYRFILYKMLSGCKSSGDLQKNNINFITFNYDVSLETYLYKGLKAIQFLNHDSGVVDHFLSDKFVHMYGQIRSKNYESFDAFGKEPVDKVIKNYKRFLDAAYVSSKDIRPIGSNLKDDEEAQHKAKDILEWAEDIYILGYGFDDENNRRLSLKNCVSRRGARDLSRQLSKNIRKNVFFTNFEDRNSINKKVSSVLTDGTEAFLGKSVFSEGNSARGSKPFYEVFYEKSIRNVYDALERDFLFF